MERKPASALWSCLCALVGPRGSSLRSGVWAHGVRIPRGCRSTGFGGPLTPVSLLPPHLGVIWSLLLFGDRVKAASVETLQGRSLPAPKGRPGWAEVARQLFHCSFQFYPFLRERLLERGNLEEQRQHPYKGTARRLWTRGAADGAAWKGRSMAAGPRRRASAEEGWPLTATERKLGPARLCWGQGVRGAFFVSVIARS